MDAAGLPYVGQSIDIDRRISEHVRNGKKTAESGIIRFLLPEQTSKALSVFEQNAIEALKDEFGDLKKDISNRRNEIGPKSRFKNALKQFKICK